MKEILILLTATLGEILYGCIGISHISYVRRLPVAEATITGSGNAWLEENSLMPLHGRPRDGAKLIYFVQYTFSANGEKQTGEHWFKVTAPIRGDGEGYIGSLREADGRVLVSYDPQNPHENTAYKPNPWWGYVMLTSGLLNIAVLVLTVFMKLELERETATILGILLGVLAPGSYLFSPWFAGYYPSIENLTVPSFTEVGVGVAFMIAGAFSFQTVRELAFRDTPALLGLNIRAKSQTSAISSDELRSEETFVAVPQVSDEPLSNALGGQADLSLPKIREHIFVKGICTSCGCSQKAFEHFKWKCE